MVTNQEMEKRAPPPVHRSVIVAPASRQAVGRAPRPPQGPPGRRDGGATLWPRGRRRPTKVTAVQLTASWAVSSLNRKQTMAVKNIKLGQVWRQDSSGQDYLVTKVYSEVFTEYAVLRPAEVNAPNVPGVKVKVAKSADGVVLPGFSFTQEGAF